MTIRPVIIDGFCVGHIIPTVKGFAAYDAADNLVGIFATAAEAIAALEGAFSGNTDTAQTQLRRRHESPGK